METYGMHKNNAEQVSRPVAVCEHWWTVDVFLHQYSLFINCFPCPSVECMFGLYCLVLFDAGHCGVILLM